MKTFSLLAIAALFLTHAAWAQVPATNSPGNKLLNAEELGKRKCFYTMEEALATPLDVYKLSLADQKMDSLPGEIGQFVNLQELNLNNCKLASLPDTLGSLTNLQVLNLGKNKLRNLPATFRNLHNLESLYLGKNRFTEIPVWIGGVGKIRKLDISRNPITPLELSNIITLLPKAQITY